MRRSGRHSGLSQALLHWREPLIWALVALGGIWLGLRGGIILAGAGLAVVGVAAVLGLSSWRRLRFAGDGGRGPGAVAPGLGPGAVDIDEGQITYFSAETGGAIALNDLAEIRLIALGGLPVWRLRQGDGQALLVPLSALGAEALYDVFAALPGMDMARLLAAMQADAQPLDLAPPLWRRR